MPAALPIALAAAGSVAQHIGAKKQAKKAAETETANIAAQWNPKANAAAARNSLIKAIMGGYGISSAVDPGLMGKLTAPAAAPTSMIQGPSTLGMIGGGLQQFGQLAAAGGFGKKGPGISPTPMASMPGGLTLGGAPGEAAPNVLGTGTSGFAFPLPGEEQPQ